MGVSGTGEDVVGRPPVVDDGAGVLGDILDASMASTPRLGCTTRRVSRFVASVCTQRLVVPTLVPVSSAWTTGASWRPFFTAVMKGPKRPAASAWTELNHPVETLAPSSSANSSAVRSRGRCWRSIR